MATRGTITLSIRWPTAVQSTHYLTTPLTQCSGTSSTSSTRSTLGEARIGEKRFTDLKFSMILRMSKHFSFLILVNLCINHLLLDEKGNCTKWRLFYKTKIEQIFLSNDKLLEYFKFIPKSLRYTAAENRYYLTHDVHHILSAYIDIKLNISQNIKLNISQDMRYIKKKKLSVYFGR